MSSPSYIHNFLKCRTFKKGWPGTSYQRPPSQEREQICNCEIPQLPGSSAWAGGICWISPAHHQGQSWTPPADVQDESTPGPWPLHCWPPAKHEESFLIWFFFINSSEYSKKSLKKISIQILTLSSCMMEAFFGSLGSSRDCVAHSPIFFMSYSPDAPMYVTASRRPMPLRHRDIQCLKLDKHFG